MNEKDILSRINRLSKLKDKNSINELISISKSYPVKNIRKYTKKVLYKLKLQGIEIDNGKYPPEKNNITSYITDFDSTLDRNLIILNEKLFSRMEVANLIVNFSYGIKKCSTGETSSKLKVNEFLENYKKEYELYEIDPAYGKYLIEEAMSVSSEKGNKLPTVFPEIESKFLKNIPTKFTQPIIYEKITDIPPYEYFIIQNLDMIDKNIETLSSLIIKYEDIKNEIKELENIHNSKIILPKYLQREKEEKVIHGFINRFFNKEKIKVYTRLLEEIAYFLFYQKDKYEEAKFFTGCAQSLINENNITENVFILSIIRVSIKLYSPNLKLIGDGIRRKEIITV